MAVSDEPPSHERRVRMMSTAHRAATVFDGLPVIGKFITVVGLPGAAFLYLLWFVTHPVTDRDSLRHYDLLQQHVTEESKSLEILLRINRQTCENVAQTEFQKVKCWDGK